MRIVSLTFHDVVPEGHEPAAGDPFYRITAAEFESLLAQLKKLGYQGVSSREFRAWQRGEAALPDRSIVLTFDDGYTGHLEHVAPILLRYRFTGSFFIAPELIGRPGYLDWTQVKRLNFLGMEIGSHGLSHEPLTEMSPEKLRHELTESRARLETQLGIPVTSLAIPRGFWNSTVAAATKTAGYDTVWLSHIGTNGQETNPLALRRLPVRQPFSLQRTIAMAEGWGPVFWWSVSQQWLIRALKRVLGTYWYEQLKRRLVPRA